MAVATGRSGWVLAAIIVAVAVIGVTTGLLVAHAHQSQPLSTETSAQLTSVQSACHQWAASGAVAGADGRWCSDLAAWMTSQIDDHGTTPADMWGDSGHMLAACEDWMAASPPAGAPLASDRQAACASMGDWMAGHMTAWSGQASWSSWMGHAKMMSH